MVNPVIPNKCIMIGHDAFHNCQKIKKIDIPASVIDIDIDGFSECDNLKKFTVDENNTNYSSFKGSIYSKDMTELIICPNAIKSITIPEGVKSIDKDAFRNCYDLEKITLPKSIEKIQNGVFSDFYGITIKVPKGLDLSKAGIEDDYKVVYY